MGYKIIVEIYLEAGMNTFNIDDAISELQKDSRIRLVSKDYEIGKVWLDMKSDFSTFKEDARWLCNKLIDVGIHSFYIRHSY